MMRHPAIPAHGHGHVTLDADALQIQAGKGVLCAGIIVPGEPLQLRQGAREITAFQSFQGPIEIGARQPGPQQHQNDRATRETGAMAHCSPLAGGKGHSRQPPRAG